MCRRLHQDPADAPGGIPFARSAAKYARRIVPNVLMSRAVKIRKARKLFEISSINHAVELKKAAYSMT